MLVLSNNLIKKQVLSLRTSSPVATILSPIVNPNNLKIEGFYCQDSTKQILILVAQDIRETVDEGYIVNDHDVLAKEEDLVRLQETLKLKYYPIDKLVVTESGKRLGRIDDYATDIDSMYIVKLYISQSLIKSFTGGSLVVDRNQIIEITPRRIVVDDLLLGSSVEAGATVASS